MNRKIFFCVIIIFLLLLSSQSFSQQDLTPEQIYEKVNDAVVIVLAYDVNGKLINQGSGVVIDDEGYIITNYHVMKNASKVNIVHSELLFENAELIGGDEESDILFIKIPKSDLSVIETPESYDVKIGQKVYAIGSPMGYENTISDGIVSGYRKFDKINLIQITASISPGSSGGAVVNSKGELIGISTYTIAEGQNINFAIPIQDLLKTNIKPYNAPNNLSTETKTEVVENDEKRHYLESEDVNYDSKAVEFLDQGKALVEKANSQQNEKDKKLFLEQAIKNFEKAIKIDSSLVEAYYLAGEYYSSTFYLYNYEKANKYLNKVETFIAASKGDILASVSNREILVGMATSYNLYGEDSIEMKLRVIEIYKKALEQPSPNKDRDAFWEYINDDYIYYQISNTYNMLAVSLIYSSIYNSEDKFFEAIKYCDFALEYYKKLSSSFKENKNEIAESYYDIVKYKKLAVFLKFNYNWELFYTNLNRRVGLLISTNNILFLYHAKSLFKDKNNIVRVWIKEVNLKDPDEYESDYYNYLKSLYEFDLNNNKFRVIQQTIYGDNNKVLSDNNYPNSEWQFISPETITETMIQNLKVIKK